MLRNRCTVVDVVEFAADAVQENVACDAVAFGFAQFQADVHSQFLVLTRVLEVLLALFAKVEECVHTGHTATSQHKYGDNQLVGLHL